MLRKAHKKEKQNCARAQTMRVQMKTLYDDGRILPLKLSKTKQEMCGTTEDKKRSEMMLAMVEVYFIVSRLVSISSNVGNKISSE